MLVLLVMVLIASVVVIVVGLKTRDDNKLVVKLFLGFSIFIVGFYVYAKMTCGPNYFDVRVMKPMAEKISAYIVKNGIPESLQDIPDLPYRLDGCERNKEYLNSDNNGGMKEVAKEKAILYNLREECHFKNIKLSYWLQKDLKTQSTGISLELNSYNSTYIEYGGGAEKDEKIVFNEKIIGSSKSSGICNPMRQ